MSMRACCWSLLLLLVASPTTGAEPSPIEYWEVLTLQGNRIGYNHTVERVVTTDGTPRLVTETFGKMQLKRAGQEMQIQFQMHFEESTTGELLRFQSVQSNPPDSKVETIGERAGTELRVAVIAGGQRTEQVIPHADQLKLPTCVDRLIKSQVIPVGETREFQVYDPQAGQVATISLRSLTGQSTRIWGGRERTLGRLEMAHSALPGIMTTVFIDPQSREIVKTAAPLIGMETYRVSKDEALQEIEPFDQLTASLIPLKTKEDLVSAKSATYVVRVDGPLDEKLFPSGPTQHVEHRPDGSLRVTVIRLQGDEPAKSATGAKSPGKEFLAATRFLECNAPLIQELSLLGRGRAGTPRDQALALEKFVRQRIQKRNLSTAMATALEVAQSRAGDCTEHAVLLAALLRAAKIPARVAVGLVHSPAEQAFIGHMWSEAWIDGMWVPLDGTRARGGTTCEYIKLTDSALSGEGAVPGTEFLPLISVQGRLTITLDNVVR